MLVEFASVVDAVCCAVDIQREMAEHNSAIPAERRIELRMGINVGDIIIDEGDIYGDASMSRHGWRGWPVQREAPLLHLACAAAGRVRLPTRRADLGHQAVQRLCFAVEHRARLLAAQYDEPKLMVYHAAMRARVAPSTPCVSARRPGMYMPAMAMPPKARNPRAGSRLSHRAMPTQDSALRALEAR